MLKLKLIKTLFDHERSAQKKVITSRVDYFEQSEESLFMESSSVKMLDQPLFEYYENSNIKRDSLEKRGSMVEKGEKEAKEGKKVERDAQKIEKTKPEKQGSFGKNQTKWGKPESRKK